MKRTIFLRASLALPGLALVMGCPGDDTTGTGGSSTGGDESTTAMAMTTPMPTGDTTVGDPSTTDMPTTTGVDSTTTGGPPPGKPADFVVTIENVSNTGLMFTPLSPGVWANHEANADALFELDVPDDGEGFAALAEDGDPTALADAVAMHGAVNQTGVFDTPVMAGTPGPLLPGDSYSFTFTAESNTRLSLATMIVGSNDLVVASGPLGLNLFAGGGQPLGERDVSSSLRIYESGTEVSQAPGQGPWQALHGGSPDIGPDEGGGGVLPFEFSTRAIPLGPDIASITLADDPMNPGTFIVSITNISEDRGALVTPLSPIVFVTHTDAITLFDDGGVASTELEALAEDGITAPLELALGGSAEVGELAVVSGPGPGPDPIMPGDTVSFSFTPDPAFPRLSMATMVVNSNDAFLAVNPEGVAMFDEAGAPLSNEDISNEIFANLTPWDAGTEENEVPGVGLNQAPRQGGLNTGPVETVNPTVHRYADVTNDLAGDSAGGFLTVSVAQGGGGPGGGGEYTITITNDSDTTAYPGIATPVLWALHDDTMTLFDVGMAASPGLELLAEDGDPSGLLGEVMGAADSGVADTPLGAMMPGPLLPGESYEFLVIPDATNRFLSFATMVVPSNDTFASTQPGGVALLDAAGAPIDAATVEADIAASLVAWDAGTEGNQAGAAGRDMAPTGAPDTGPSNGNGLVREADEDEIWSYPSAEGIIRVIIAPVEG